MSHKHSDTNTHIHQDTYKQMYYINKSRPRTNAISSDQNHKIQKFPKQNKFPLRWILLSVYGNLTIYFNPSTTCIKIHNALYSLKTDRKTLTQTHSQ